MIITKDNIKIIIMIIIHDKMIIHNITFIFYINLLKIKKFNFKFSFFLNISFSIKIAVKLKIKINPEFKIL